MSIVKRLVKGSALTHAEIDNNFAELAAAVPQGADYVISISGGTITSQPKYGSSLSVISGTNATTVINSAIAALTSGGEIVISKGSYTIPSSIIDGGVSGVTITFQRGAKFVAGNAINAPIIWVTDVNNWTINNPEIDGNAINQGTPNYSGSVLADGIFIHSSNNSTVNTPNIYNCRRFGVNVDGISHNTGVIGGVVRDCGWNGITLGENSNAKDCFARFTEVYNCSDVGITTYGVRTEIVGNVVHDITGTTGYNSARWGIAVETTDNSVDHCIIEENTIYNVNVCINVAANCNNNTIRNNELFNWDLTNNYMPAIWVYSDRNRIQGNVAEKSTGNGIAFTLAGSASYNFVEGNIAADALIGFNCDGTSSYNTFTNNYSKSRSNGFNINNSGSVGNRIVNNDWSQSASDLNDAGTGTIIGPNIWKSGYKTPLDTEVKKEVVTISCSDLTTALTTGAGKGYFRMPWAGTLTGVRLSVRTAPTGSSIIVNVKENGTTVFTTKPSIAISSKTSVGGTAAVISDSALADDAEISIDIDQVGSTIAGAGLMVTLFITRA